MSRNGPLVLSTNRSTLGVDGVLGVAEHVHHVLGGGVDEPLVARLLGFCVLVLHRQKDGHRQGGRHDDRRRQRHRCDQRPVRLPPRRRADGFAATGTLAGASALSDRARRCFGDLAVSGPAGRDARRRPVDFGDSVEAVSSSSTPASEPTSDQPSFPAGASCQFHPRTRQFPRLGRRTCRSGHRSRRPSVARCRRRAAARPAAAAHRAGGWPGSGKGPRAGGGGGGSCRTAATHLIGRRIERPWRRRRSRFVRRHRQRERPVRRRARSRRHPRRQLHQPAGPGSGSTCGGMYGNLFCGKIHPRIVDRLAAVWDRRPAPRIAAERDVSLRVAAQLNGRRALTGELLARIVARAAHHRRIVLRRLAVQLGRNVAQRGVGGRADLRGRDEAGAAGRWILQVDLEVELAAFVRGHAAATVPNAAISAGKITSACSSDLL